MNTCVNKQIGFNDSGVFAAAYCTALVYGEGPSTLVYNQACMRKQLELCLSRRKMDPFSSVRSPKKWKEQN